MSKGKLITVWNPLCCRMGATTTAIGIATILSWVGYKKTLLTSISADNKLSLYLSNDKKIRYGMDYLQVFGDQILISNIIPHTTKLTNTLDVIGGYMIDDELVDKRHDFHIAFINEVLQEYDYFILDMSNDFDEEILDRSDMVIALIPFEKMALDELYLGKFSNYMNNPKVVPVFNKLSMGLKDELEKQMSKYEKPEYIYLPDNRYIQYSVGFEYKLYSFITENMRWTKQIYIKNLLLLYDKIVLEDSIEKSRSVVTISNFLGFKSSK